MDEYRSGKYFVACKSKQYNNIIVKDQLDMLCPDGYTVKTYNDTNIFLAKIVYSEYIEDRDPYKNYDSNIVAVSGFDQKEIEEANDLYSDYGESDYDRKHSIINKMYKDYNENVFSALRHKIDFCSVIWDKYNKKLVAGVTDGNNTYSHLYYGYDNDSNIMYSNSEEILSSLCDKVYELESNSYMTDNTIYDLDGNERNRGDNMRNQFVKETRENADYLLKGINTMLFQITGEEVRKQIDDNINDYLKSDDPKKKIEDYIVNQLDNDTKIEVLKLVKNKMEELNIEQQVNEKITNILDDAVEEYKKKNIVPINNVITLNDVKKGETGGGFFHEKFEQILRQVQIDEPIMLIGPAGSGKNVAIKQVADALGFHMYYTNNASNEFKLTGFIDAGGNYRDTEFYKAFKNGGIFFLDEIDNSDPSALIVINSALANGYMAFPHETIERHKDFRIISAANTWGKGADLQYVGRNALDGATLDRFDNIFFDYDKNLERALYPNEEVLEFMWSFRNAVYNTKMPHIVSTRGIGKVYKKEINNIPVNDILTSNVIKNLQQDDLNTLIGSMNNISNNNKYYYAVKRLSIRR